MSEFRTWIQRRNSARADIASSIADQGLLSGGSFLATGVLAYSLSAAEFGKFTVAWSIAALFESALLKPLLDDPLPSVSVRLHGNIAQLRSSFILWSAISAGSIGGLGVFLSLFWATVGLENAPLFATTGLLIVACRLQNAMRRILYLDNRLRIVLCAATTYVVILSASLALTIERHQITAVTAMLCISLSSAAAFSLSLANFRKLARPTKRVFFWSLRKLVWSGRWIAAAGLAFWAGSVGVIPVAAIFVGGAASGSLRILFLIFAPLGQINAALQLTMIPRAAVTLRSRDMMAAKRMATEKAVVFGSLSAAYGLCALLLCTAWLIPANLFPHGYRITIAEIFWMCAAMAFEGIWTGLALPLYATAQTRQFLVSRLVSVPFLLVIFPLATWMWGIAGTVAAIAASSATSAIVLALRPASSVVRTKADSIARVIHPEAI